MKRFFDILLAFAASVVLLPLIVCTYLTILLTMGQPVFFRQTRPGLQGKLFSLIKFRTMSNARDQNGEVLLDEQRLNGLGRVLRAISIDELPELINVFKGDMSIVGPRPLLTQYLDRYTQEQARRHEVKPGLTGWAQVNGRNSLSWDDKFKLDVWYVDNWSFRLDLRIIGMTLRIALRREGISAEGEATMSEFMGSQG